MLLRFKKVQKLVVIVIFESCLHCTYYATLSVFYCSNNKNLMPLLFNLLDSLFFSNVFSFKGLCSLCFVFRNPRATGSWQAIRCAASTASWCPSFNTSGKKPDLQIVNQSNLENFSSSVFRRKKTFSMPFVEWINNAAQL